MTQGCRSTSGRNPDFTGSGRGSALAPGPYGKWYTAYTLKNAAISVIVAPAAGGIIAISGPSGENLLSEQTESSARSARSLNGRVARSGGSALHVTAPAETGAGTPKIQSGAWKASAWINSNGSQSCLLTLETGNPLYTAVTRMITVPSLRPEVHVNQRLRRIGYSDHPVCLHTETRAEPQSLVFLPPVQDIQGRLFTHHTPDSCTNGLSVIPAHNIEIPILRTPGNLDNNGNRAWFGLMTPAGETLLVTQGNSPDGADRESMNLQFTVRTSGTRTVHLWQDPVLLPAGEYLESETVFQLIGTGDPDMPCEAGRMLMEKAALSPPRKEPAL